MAGPSGTSSMMMEKRRFTAVPMGRGVSVRLQLNGVYSFHRAPGVLGARKTRARRDNEEDEKARVASIYVPAPRTCALIGRLD